MMIIDDKTEISSQPISEALERVIKNHLQTNKSIVDLYKLVLEVVEEPLLRCTIEHFRYNQTRAAATLGISRRTLRSKLKHYFADQYVGSRE